MTQNPQPRYEPCHGCGLPMVVAPANFYGRDHSGSRLCDGLIRPNGLGVHYRTTETVNKVREWLERERNRYA